MFSHFVALPTFLYSALTYLSLLFYSVSLSCQLKEILIIICDTRFRDISKYIPTSQLKYEATVGAGLPLISTLHSIIRSGDSIVKIEGILSGTLSYIFNNLSSSKPFSTVVGEARNLGYTEPDPRNDLDGMDVARKVVILARTCGMYVEGTNSVSRTSLVNEKLVEIEDTEDFLRYLPEFDRDISSLMEAADKKGKVLRYVGSVDVTVCGSR